MIPEKNMENPGSEKQPREDAAKSEPAVEAPVVARRSGVTLAVAAAILAVPLAYLALRMAGNKHVVPAVQSAPAQTGEAQTNIPAMEATARANPSAANRVNLSLAYINGGTPVRAIPVLESVVKDDPNNVQAWNNLCVALTLQKDYATAIDDCNRALTIQPGFQLARNNLKWASDEQKKMLADIATARQSATVQDGPFFLEQGMKELHVGDYDQAIVSWQHTLQLQPHNALAANNIGTAYMMKKHPEDAIPWFNKAIAFDPSMQLAKNNLAWAQSVLQAQKH